MSAFPPEEKTPPRSPLGIRLARIEDKIDALVDKFGTVQLRTDRALDAALAAHVMAARAQRRNVVVPYAASSLALAFAIVSLLVACGVVHR